MDAIDLYQLHTPDPKERFESQVEALAELKQAGKVKHVGLSNVSVDELERARKIVPIVGVTPYQVALAWLLAKSPIAIPIPGASKLGSARSSAAAMALKLTPDDVNAIG